MYPNNWLLRQKKLRYVLLQIPQALVPASSVPLALLWLPNVLGERRGPPRPSQSDRYPGIVPTHSSRR